MGAGVWLGAVLHRLQHAAGNRATQLSDAAAMTDEERQRFSRRLREANAEIERLEADNERLRVALQTVRAENDRANGSSRTSATRFWMMRAAPWSQSHAAPN